MRIPILLFGVALGVRLAALVVWPFDGLYGQDAYDYYHYAVSLRESLAQGGGVPPFFWPIGYPLHIVAGQLIIGMQPSAGQAVSVIAGALVAPLTYALAHEALKLTDPRRAQRAGLVAGLVVAVAGQMLISSISIMSDATGLAWATLSAWLVVRYARTLRPATLALASLTLSLAVITRWVFGLLVLPWSLAVALAWRRGWSLIGWRRGIALGLMACAIGGSIVGAQLLGGDSHTGDLQVVGWNPANAFRSEVINTDGVWRYTLPIGLFYLQPLVVPGYVFPLFIPLWLAGLAALGRSDAPVRVLLVGWPLVVYIFLAGIAWQNPRFALAFFPPLAVWVGAGFDRVWVGRPTWRRGLVGLTAVALAGSLVWSGRVVNSFIQVKNVDLARTQRVANQLPPGARVITFGLTLTLRHYTDLDVIEIYDETSPTLADHACGRDAAYLYLDVANIEEQWRGLPPEINYRWLREAQGLEMVDRFGGYTLFRVNRACG
jgi:4-amino-4-deoxy-L-arabinose transferase-like glycosyltransferase